MTEFRAFVRAHATELRSAAFHLTADPVAARDLLYAGLATTYRRWDRVEHSLPAVREVLTRTATARWRPWSWRLRQSDVQDDVFTEVADLDDAALVLGAVQQLSPQLRAAVGLHVLGEAAPAELSAALRELRVLLSEIESPADELDLEARVRRAYATGLREVSAEDDLAAVVVSRARRTRWTRVAVAVGAVVLVAAAAVVLRGFWWPDAVASSESPAASDAPAGEAPRVPLAGNLPVGPPPRVLYAENAYEAGGGYLYDGTVRVPIPPRVRILPFGRVNGGWLVVRGDAHDFPNGRPHHGRVGVLHPDGGFVAYGFAYEWNATLSPDGRRAAFISPLGEELTGLVVIDLDTGRHTEVIPAGSLIGWNPDGIWYRTTNTYVWQPGGKPRLVRDAGALVVRRDRSWVTELADGCVVVAELRPDGRLARGPRHCGDGVLTPDGRYVQLPAGAVQVLPGAGTSRVRATDYVSGVTWEDPGHALLHIATGNVTGTREVVVRCHLRPGRCEIAYDRSFGRSAPAQRLTLHEP